MSRRRTADDSGVLLARALVASAAAAGCEASVASLDTRDWASATFVGARHLVLLAIPANIARFRWLASLVEAELPVRGQVALPPSILSADEDNVLMEVITLDAH